MSSYLDLGIGMGLIALVYSRALLGRDDRFQFILTDDLGEMLDRAAPRILTDLFFDLFFSGFVGARPPARFPPPGFPAPSVPAPVVLLPAPVAAMNQSNTIMNGFDVFRQNLIAVYLIDAKRSAKTWQGPPRSKLRIWAFLLKTCEKIVLDDSHLDRRCRAIYIELESFQSAMFSFFTVGDLSNNRRQCWMSRCTVRIGLTFTIRAKRTITPSTRIGSAAARASLLMRLIRIPTWLGLGVMQT